MKIVDCFPWFAPYGEELLYLRVNLLKDHVDKFIIVESNRTHAGELVERKFPEVARKLGLPIEKIIYIEHDIPETQDLKILEIDRRNAGPANQNKESLYARVRERMQKNAILEGMHEFDLRDVFIYGDADEIIDPKNIKWVANVAHNHPNQIIKVPLVYLQGRADLRVYHDNGDFVIWKRAMFFATKEQLQYYTPANIRCGNVATPIRFPTHDGVVQEDMGWHFAWMGTNQQRQIKADSFAHAHDTMGALANGTYANYKKFVDTMQLHEGSRAPDNFADRHLKRYPHDKLPKLIFETPFVKDFLLPEVKITDDYTFNDCKCYWCERVEWPLMHDLENNGEKLWFEVPRSGSVTVKYSYPDRTQVSRGTRLYNKFIEEKKKPIMVFTDPVDRFLSLMNVYLVKRERYFDYGKDLFATFGVDINQVPKEQKIDLFFRNLNKISSVHQGHHFHPQCRFVDTENFDEIEVVDKADMAEYFNTDLYYNITQKVITREDLSEAQIDFIKRAYASDYEFYEKYKVKKNAKTKNKRKNS